MKFFEIRVKFFVIDFVGYFLLFFEVLNVGKKLLDLHCWLLFVF